MHVKYYSPVTRCGILQADRAHYRLAWAAVTLTRLRPPARTGPGGNSGGGGGGEEMMVFRVLGISGTIRKAEERLVRKDQLEVFLGES